MKKIIILLLALMVAFTFISCDEPEAPHKHDFVSKFDTENHWLECSCKEKKDVAKHDLYTAEIKEDKIIIKCRGCEYTTEDAIAKYVVVNEEADLQKAISDNTDKIVILNKDLALKDRVVLPAYKTTTITLDLNGHSLSLAPELVKPDTSSRGLICVYGTDSKLVIDDTSKERTGIVDVVTGNEITEEGKVPYIASAIVVWADNDKGVSLVINGGTIKGLDYAITGNGTCIWENASSIEINGGRFEATAGTTIYNPQNGSLLVNGGAFVGEDSAIEIRAGNLKITNGTFTAKATEYKCGKNGNGTSISGAAIGVSQHTTKLPINVEILGGEFVGQKGIVKENPQNNDAESFAKVTVAVKGGKFSTNPGELVATGFKAVELSGAWVVSKAE